jgi:hypothetical protein
MADDNTAQQYVVFDPARLLDRHIDEPLPPSDIEDALWRTLDQTHTELHHDDYVIARQPQGIGWNPKLGDGILDAFAAYQRLVVNFPS